VSSTGNYVPEMFADLYNAAINGDVTTADLLQDKTDAIARIYQENHTLGESLTALKVMMQTKGLCEPWMLPPLSRLSGEEERLIEEKTKLINP